MNGLEGQDVLEVVRPRLRCCLEFGIVVPQRPPFDRTAAPAAVVEAYRKGRSSKWRRTGRDKVVKRGITERAAVVNGGVQNGPK